MAESQGHAIRISAIRDRTRDTARTGEGSVLSPSLLCKQKTLPNEAKTEPELRPEIKQAPAFSRLPAELGAEMLDFLMVYLFI